MMDITRYSNQLVGFSGDPIKYDNFKFDCEKCNKKETVFSKIYLPSNMSRGHVLILRNHYEKQSERLFKGYQAGEDIVLDSTMP
jgi:hypothetical protein